MCTEEKVGISKQIFLSIIAFFLCASISFGRYSGGSGEPNTPYRISDANDMNEIGTYTEDWNAHFVLVNDINMSDYTGTEFSIIGTGSSSSFTGVFDGNGHSIANFSYTSTGRNYIGIFGWLAGEGQIKNLGVVDCNINAGDGDYIGGLLGRNFGEGHVYNCFTTGRVSGDQSVGGLVGKNGARVSNCYSMAEVSGTQYVGGLIGHNFSFVMRCYSTGHVTGSLNTGGLIGRTSGGVIYNSYWDVLTSGQIDSDGGRGRGTGQLKSSSNYLGWGAEGVWRLDEWNDYARLIWEDTPGEDIVDPGANELYGGGAGTEDQPYLIYTPEQFNNIGLFWEDWDKHFKLMADVDLSVLGIGTYNIIGVDFDLPFVGTFDGNGHSVTGFYYTEGKYLLGLWGVIYSDDSVIKNITLINSQIISPGAEWIGSLAGYLVRGKLINCHIRNGSISGQANIGGLVGVNSSGYIIASSAECDVSGPLPSISGYKDRYGGLVGENNSYIYQSHSSGSVYGNKSVGGLVGFMYHGEVIDCYSTANVTLGEESCVGGLIGLIFDANIQNCYSTGFVDGGPGSSVGGLIGSAMSSTVENSFWDVNSSDLNNSARGSGKTTEQMQTMSTFTDVGWDFVDEDDNGFEDIWRMCIDGQDYPKLNCEFSKGDFACPDGVDFFDLKVFTDQWLQEGAYSADIAPEPEGDGLVNLLDFAILGKKWFEGVE